MMLEYLEVPYDETRYDSTVAKEKNEWFAAKEKMGMEFPNPPYLIDGDVKMSQSIASGCSCHS